MSIFIQNHQGFNTTAPSMNSLVQEACKGNDPQGMFSVESDGVVSLKDGYRYAELSVSRMDVIDSECPKGYEAKESFSLQGHVVTECIGIIVPGGYTNGYYQSICHND